GRRSVPPQGRLARVPQHLRDRRSGDDLGLGRRGLPRRGRLRAALPAAVNLSRWRRSAGIWVATGLLFAISAVFQPQSLGTSALAALWPFAAVLILAATGQTLVVQQRGIDLSVPGFISLTVVLVTHIPNENSAMLLPAILLAYA